MKGWEKIIPIDLIGKYGHMVLTFRLTYIYIYILLRSIELSLMVHLGLRTYNVEASLEEYIWRRREFHEIPKDLLKS
jgi:hypothetical protein